jgi:beta-lactamase regulating signal transducer with metallopeptidase domain
MNVDSTFFLSAALKISLLIAGSLLLVLALWKAEPRWRVVVLRAVLFALPVAALAGAMAPTFRLPVSMHGAIADGASAALPTVLVPSGEVVIIDSGREMAAAAVGNADIAAAATLPLWQVVLGLWLLGSLVLLVRERVLKRRVARELAEAVDGDESLRGEWKAICDEFGIESVPLLKVGATKSSPFLIGGKNPRLLLPQSLVKDGSVSLRCHVFRHEAAHLAAGDLRWLAAMRWLTRVFWLQPLLWLLEAKHLQACEEAADAEAARRGGTRQYRGALASLALELVPTGSATPATAFFRGPSVVRRLRAVVRHGNLRPPSRWRSLILMAMIVVIGAVLGNVGLAERDDSSPIDLQMAELSYEGYQESHENGETERAMEYLKMAIEYLPKDPALEKRRQKWQKELERLAFLEKVAVGWEVKPETKDVKQGGEDPVMKSLREIVVPLINLEDVPLTKALDLLYRQADKLNGDEKLPFRFEFDVEENAKQTQITLKLENVPMVEALRYITSLAQLNYHIEITAEGNVIRIVSLVSPEEELYTNVYSVVGVGEFEKDGADAKRIFEGAGIVFPESASAMLLAERGQLIVRNTQSQMELVEVWLEDARQRAIDPSNIWFRAFTQMKEGEALEDQGKLLEALGKYEQSKALFDSVFHAHPEFHPEIVRFRRKELEEKIAELRQQTGRRGPMVIPPVLVPNHPVELPKKSVSDDVELGLLLPAVPVLPPKSGGEMRDELAPPVLQFKGINSEWGTSDDGGQIRTLTVQVTAGSGATNKIDAAKMSLVVRFYDRVGSTKLQIGSGETETRFPSISYDWTNRAEGETVEVEYRLPKATMKADDREYFGHVAELYYDGVLQGVTAGPSKLLRLVE